MTKKELRSRFNGLLPEMKRALVKRMESMATSGAVDLESYGNDYELPKLMLCAAMLDVSSDYFPFSEDERCVVENLRHF